MFFTELSAADSPVPKTAEGPAEVGYLLTNQYVSGHYLIFDCSGDFFACVDGPSYSRCEQARNGAREFKKRHLKCAPLKRFAHEKECHATQYQLMHKKRSTIFCDGHIDLNP